jgi:nitroreductase/dihydropteridine reductase
MGSEQSSFTNSLEWRRAVKHFGTGPVDTSPIVEAMINAPSSFGLQPYKILAVSNKELKEKLKPLSYNQPQITECQTLFILCARTDVEARAEEYLKATEATSRGMRDMLMGFVSYLPDKTAWAAKQAYIALGFGLAAAAEHKIASCPMEGFSSADVAKLLELPDTLVPVVFLAVGEATDTDGTYPRFRFSSSDLVHVYS